VLESVIHWEEGVFGQLIHDSRCVGSRTVDLISLSEAPGFERKVQTNPDPRAS
jgi:hypothetical protein